MSVISDAALQQRPPPRRALTGQRRAAHCARQGQHGLRFILIMISFPAVFAPWLGLAIPIRAR